MFRTNEAAQRREALKESLFIRRKNTVAVNLERWKIELSEIDKQINALYSQKYLQHYIDEYQTVLAKICAIEPNFVYTNDNANPAQTANPKKRDRELVLVYRDSDEDTSQTTTPPAKRLKK